MRITSHSQPQNHTILARPFDLSDDVPEPPSATGQYPDPVWAQSWSLSLAQQDLEEAPEPPSATGQYPDPVWVETTTESAQAFSAEPASEQAPEAPSATGQYPDPVWNDKRTLEIAPADAQGTTSAEPITETGSEAALSFKEADYQSEALPTPIVGVEPDATSEAAELDYQEMYQIIRQVAVADSGDALFSAISADREYETPGSPAYQRRHFGLGFGLVLFTQESGLLGKLLQIMQRRDPATFAQLFAPHAEALIVTTNAATAKERLQPVGEQLLWQPSWIERFRRAGEHEAFRIAQNETAIEFQFRPMLPVALGLGFTSDRALAMVYDRVVARGLGAGLHWVVQQSTPLRSQAQIDHALQTLGFRTLADFQNAMEGPPYNSVAGVETHAALVGELRRQGQIPMPTANDLMARLVSAAQGAAHRRLIRLRDSEDFVDVQFQP